MKVLYKLSSCYSFERFYRWKTRPLLTRKRMKAEGHSGKWDTQSLPTVAEQTTSSGSQDSNFQLRKWTPLFLSLYQETQLQYLWRSQRSPSWVRPRGPWDRKHREGGGRPFAGSQTRAQQSQLEAGLERNKHVLSGLWVQWFELSDHQPHTQHLKPFFLKPDLTRTASEMVGLLPPEAYPC